MSALVKLSDNYSALDDASKVNLFKSATTASPTIAELQAIGKFKVMVYKENS